MWPVVHVIAGHGGAGTPPTIHVRRKRGVANLLRVTVYAAVLDVDLPPGELPLRVWLELRRRHHVTQQRLRHQYQQTDRTRHYGERTERDERDPGHNVPSAGRTFPSCAAGALAIWSACGVARNVCRCPVFASSV